VTATFSEAVQGVDGSTFVLRGGAGAAVPAAVTYDAGTRVATLDPTADLAAGTRYTATLTGGPTAVRDVANNPLADVTWSFTTAAAAAPVPPADTAAPTVTARGPSADATGVVRSGNVTVTFSEAVTGVAGATVVLRNAGGATIPAVVTYDAGRRTATLNPSSTLPSSTRYTVSLYGGTNGIKDVAGNPLANGSWSFTTGR
jgi:hypothetical protein